MDAKVLAHISNTDPERLALRGSLGELIYLENLVGAISCTSDGLRRDPTTSDGSQFVWLYVVVAILNAISLFSFPALHQASHPTSWGLRAGHSIAFALKFLFRLSRGVALKRIPTLALKRIPTLVLKRNLTLAFKLDFFQVLKLNPPSTTPTR
ncbi:hypothetical protein GGF50DRAFT_111773 [Schizophyllum commune]